MKPTVTKKYLKLLAKPAVQKVLEVLYRYPEREFSLSDIAKEASIAKAHIGKSLDALHNAGFIEIAKLAKIWRIKADQRNLNFIRSKIARNLNVVCQSGLIEFLDVHFKNPKAIILFGSFRKGEDISGSDIDIAIETGESGEYETTRIKELSQFEKEIERKVQVHLFNRRKVDINVFNNIADGVTLSGFLEVRP